MRKGYLPYMESEREHATSGHEPQLSFDFAPDTTVSDLPIEQLDALRRAVRKIIESGRHAQPDPQLVRLRDAFYSLNVLPPHNIGKYFDKARIYMSEEAAIRSDWEKIGLDLWTSLLRIKEERTASE